MVVSTKTESVIVTLVSLLPSPSADRQGRPLAGGDPMTGDSPHLATPSEGSFGRAHAGPVPSIRTQPM